MHAFLCVVVQLAEWCLRFAAVQPVFLYLSYCCCFQKSEDLVSLDLEELAANCQADYSEGSDKELQDPNAFALSALQPAAKKGLPHCQYYLGRCYETGIQTAVECTS